MEGRARWALRACNQIKSLLFFSCRFPSFTRAQIERLLEVSAASGEQELAEHERAAYWASSAQHGRLQACLFMLVFFLYTFWIGLIPFRTFQLFDYSRPERSLRALTDAQGNELLEFACLATDCRRPLSSGELDEPAGPLDEKRWARAQLARDASKLPLLSICQPALDQFYMPAVRLDAFGMLALTVSSLYIYLHGVWLPAQQLLLPCSNLLIMFLVAPGITRRVMVARARELLLDLAISFDNYRLEARYQLASSFLADAELGKLSSPRWAARPRRRAAGAGARPAAWPGRALEPAPGLHSDQQAADILSRAPFSANQLAPFRRLVDRCVPSIRSNWWRQRMARCYCWTTLLFVTCIILTGLAAFAYVQHRIWLKQRLLGEFERNMRQANCSLWLAAPLVGQQRVTEPRLARQPVRLDRIRVQWTVRSFLESAIFNYIPGITSGLLSAYYWALILEMDFWLAELRLYLCASLVIARFGLDQAAPCSSRGARAREPASGQCALQFDLAHLRAKFLHETRFWFHFILAQVERPGHKASRVTMLNSAANDSAHIHSFLQQLDLVRARTPDDNIETLEQIYVNFRLFIEHVRALTPSVVILLTIIYTLTFGLVIIGIYYSRKIEHFYSEPLFISIFGWSISSVLILWGANFHAQSRRLEPLLWSIIAQLSLSDNVRAKHIRLLFVRQLKTLNNEGGLALRAFGIKVTYVNIIQSIIWMATIFAIAIKV